jgi:polysaccharide pyruvyl transferase WcaK-like protein
MIEGRLAATDRPRILLLGIGLETGNLGLGALAHGTLASIYHAYPDATVSLLDYGIRPQCYHLEVSGKKVTIELVNLRFSWRFFLRNNIFTLLSGACVARLLPSSFRARILCRNGWLRKVAEADIALAISGGDSFSDIYGMRRLLYVSLPQFLVLALSKPLVLLPQTYGPFESRRSRILAGAILKRASRIFARDRTSLDVALGMLSTSATTAEFSFDMGFALEPLPPPPSMLGPIASLDPARPIVGLNVSGLLYMGGYSQDNMFGLKIPYAQLLTEIVRSLVSGFDCQFLLIPHVFGDSPENDVSACRRFRGELSEDLRARVVLMDGVWDQSQIKYVIGKCHFFIGSRMHACIAALSQSVPAVGLAYSMKFEGVFRSVGVPQLVLDLARTSQGEVLAQISNLFRERAAIAANLSQSMPQVRATILDLVQDKLRGLI